MATFVITKTALGRYKLAYHDYKGTAIAVSPALDSTDDCMETIQQFKEQFDEANIVTLKTPKEQHFFQMELHQAVVFKSRKFNTLLRMEKALEDFKKNFVISEILDFTENIFETQP